MREPGCEAERFSHRATDEVRPPINLKTTKALRIEIPPRCSRAPTK